jgi:hypothetical protein
LPVCAGAPIQTHWQNWIELLWQSAPPVANPNILV